MKETSQTYANMLCMNGVTSEIKQQHFPTTRKFWGEYLAQPEEQAMKWPNGYSRQMAELSQERSLRHLRVYELHSPVEIKKTEVFDELIKRRRG